jgi:hypothetical protein
VETLKITKLAQMADAAVMLRQAGADWHVPLIRAAMCGDIRFAMVPPGSRLPLRLLDMTREPRPFVVVLNGDGGGPAEPDAFPQARRLFQWARFAMLHGAGGNPFHYQCAVEAARVVGRVVIAETTGAALPAWVALKQATAPTTPGLVIEPRGPHPINTAPAGTVVQ